MTPGTLGTPPAGSWLQPLLWHRAAESACWASAAACCVDFTTGRPGPRGPWAAACLSSTSSSTAAATATSSAAVACPACRTCCCLGRPKAQGAASCCRCCYAAQHGRQSGAALRPTHSAQLLHIHSICFVGCSSNERSGNLQEPTATARCSRARRGVTPEGASTHSST